MGWLNVIIKEKLYDDKFVREWTNAPFLVYKDENRLLRESDIIEGGSEKNYLAWDKKFNGPVIYQTEKVSYEKNFVPALKCHGKITLRNGKKIVCETVWENFNNIVDSFSPELVESLTWVPAKQIVEAARTYATIKPAVLMTHMGVTMQSNVIQTSRLLSILIAITGNFDLKEGNGVVQYPIDSYHEMSSKIFRADRDVESKQIGAQEYPLFSGPDSIRAKVHPGLWYKDIEKGGMIKALWTSSNPVVHSEDSVRVIEALKKLDLLVVCDFFRTPTADIADYIIPPACWLERDEISDNQNYPNFIAARQKVVEPIGECRDEFLILFDLLKRMGYTLPFPESITTPEELFDFRLKKVGISFNEFKKLGIISVPLTEKKYAAGMLRKDKKLGFETPTGKCEIWSTSLERYGYSPLPNSQSTYPESDIIDQYPLILTDGRTLEIYHGLGLTLTSRRKRVPVPIVEINPQTALDMDINEGAWVWITTHQNKHRFKRQVVFSNHLHPKVIWCNTHFHYPEKEGLMERLEPNINLTHSFDGPLDPIDGASQIRGVPCKITLD